jgi:hypothetical protein
MTANSFYQGPGLIEILTAIDFSDTEKCAYEDFKQPIKHDDGVTNPYFTCGECGVRLNQHTKDCPIFKKFIEQEKQRKESPPYQRPDWMCPTCDQPKSGPHRFSCAVMNSGRLVLPVEKLSDGTFRSTIPFK